MPVQSPVAASALSIVSSSVSLSTAVVVKITPWKVSVLAEAVPAASDRTAAATMPPSCFFMLDLSRGRTLCVGGDSTDRPCLRPPPVQAVILHVLGAAPRESGDEGGGLESTAPLHGPGDARCRWLTATARSGWTASSSTGVTPAFTFSPTRCTTAAAPSRAYAPTTR